MKTHWKKEDIAGLIEKYYEGTTSRTEEQGLGTYFSVENDLADLQAEQAYFRTLNELKTKQTRLSLSDEKPADFSKRRYSLSYVVKISAVAASIALVIIGGGIGAYLQINSKDYVLIDGKRYTDKETMEQVFLASLQNVKINMQELSNDLDDAIQW
jgi:hypothetical protein